jgi:hypothetical protein
MCDNSSFSICPHALKIHYTLHLDKCNQVILFSLINYIRPPKIIRTDEIANIGL